MRTIDAADSSGIVSWCSQACADADGWPVPDMRLVRARLASLSRPQPKRIPPMPRSPALSPGRCLLVTVRLPLPPGVLAEAETIAGAAAAIRALRDALGDGAVIDEAIETVRPARKSRAPRLVATPPAAA
jgi:hypothetical protein